MFMPLRSCILPAKHCGGLNFSNDLVTLKCQCQGHKVKFKVTRSNWWKLAKNHPGPILIQKSWIWPVTLTFSLKVMTKNNVILCMFMPFTGLYIACKTFWWVEFFKWPCDLERSRSRSKGQVQGHKVKLLEMVQNHPGPILTPILWFWPVTLTFNLKVKAKHIILCMFMSFRACMSPAKMVGVEIFHMTLWPRKIKVKVTSSS